MGIDPIEHPGAFGKSSTRYEDTKKVPLEMWVKSYLQKDAEIGEEVEVITRTEEKETGQF